MEIRVNGQDISPSAFQIAFLEPPFSDSDNEKPLPEPCLTPEIVSRMGLTEASQEKVTYWNNGQCADFRQLSGVEIRPNPAEGMLYINMPQAWLEYSDASWLPPSRWDNGIPGLLFDYNINGTVNKPHQGKQSQSLNYNGTAGLTRCLASACGLSGQPESHHRQCAGDGQPVHLEPFLHVPRHPALARKSHTG